MRINQYKKSILIFITVVIFIVGTLLCSSCTKNDRAKNFGGTMEVKLQANRKLITVTWKDDDLWYLTRPMHENESPETCQLPRRERLGLL